MPDKATTRLTQHDIARMTGVSQATVSLVLNSRTDATARIAPETRDRVLRAIAETGYVADPRRPAAGRRAQPDHRRVHLRAGVPQRATATSTTRSWSASRSGPSARLRPAPADQRAGGRRAAAHLPPSDNRLRLADGCRPARSPVAGRDELARLVAEVCPFVSIGRRDDAGGPVPYVGADYAAARRARRRRAVALGHRRLAYLGQGAGAESWADRLRGFRDGGQRACTGHARPADRAAG